MKLRVSMFLMGIGLWSCTEDTQIKVPTPYVLEPPPLFNDNYDLPVDNPLTVEGIALGRQLFYEKQLSRNSTISCGSCHQQAHAFTDGTQFSQGVDGELTTRHAMSLVNLLWQTKFFWDGRASTLEEQALQPIADHIEMDLTLDEAVERLMEKESYRQSFFAAFETEAITAGLIAKALGQFMRTLISADSKYDRYLLGAEAFTPQEKLGMDLFFTHPVPSIGLRGGNCGDCHVPILTSGDRQGFNGFHNNGLTGEKELEAGLMAVTGKAVDQGKFKAPSLRNIALTAPYMHDGRFSTLEEVLDHYNEGIQTSPTLDALIVEATNNPTQELPVKLGLTQEEKEAIIVFLQTLTDNNFIHNEDFSDPFKP
ncbi:cytochrome-c peroxidase [Reichenbachiella carrageenanivorans]|uniref:Cytochrome-c peroxidase n=1 Tax=Reichenbachiella carrageenanivorans TaxID=2979869 RepID=A0ABY6CVM7_9BACT|nr:cytochrome c peroxidase [Reichenbachiella carrageenanivorans]UXX77962.1 cytochrome-c peroxidase [Reichenbachiella carrageenanivorans]